MTGVSIVGIGCRVPGAEGGGKFWRMLLAGRDANDPSAGHPPDVDAFDAEWFGLADRAAALMDPRQRLAMEVAVAAIDDAGIGYRTRGSGAAVLFGADAPHVTAAGLGLLSDRLSGALDLRGPSLVLDGANSSPLASVDMAVRLLAEGSVPFAIVGAVHFAPLTHDPNHAAGSAFSATTGRALFGCAVVILQCTEDAVREGNRVYAEIAGVAVRAAEHSGGHYALNGRTQRDAFGTQNARARFDPADVGFLEYHSKAAALGGHKAPDVLSALTADNLSARDQPIWLGSIQSDIGDLAAASGVTGLIKTALAVHHGVIPPMIGVDHASASMLAERGLRVPSAAVDWSPVPLRERRAALRSFNAHAVLRGVESPSVVRGGNPPVLIPVTGRDAAELGAQADRLADKLEHSDEQLREFASAVSRLLPDRTRACVLVQDRPDAIRRLRAVAQGDSGATIIGPSATRRRGGVLFLFAGLGGQHLAMGRALAARHSAFAHALARAADAIVAAGGPRVWTPRHGFATTPSGGDPRAMALVAPALFAFQLAMAELLAAWGIRPDAVTGHGLGEIAAAAVGGALSLSDAASVVVRRGMLPALAGATALLEAAPHDAAKLVEPMRAQVGIAAINGPRSVVVSGTPRYIDTLVRRARRRDMVATRLPDDVVADAPLFAGVPAGFGDGLAPMTPHTPVYSTARRAELIDTAAMDGEYWAENASRTVELAAALERAAADGLSTVLEVAPHSLLASAVQEYPEFRDATHAVASRDDEAGTFLACVARLHLEGRPVDWSAQGPFGTAPRRVWRKRRLPSSIEPVVESGLTPADLTDDVVEGVPTVPAAHWLRGLLALARTGSATVLTDFVVHERVALAMLPEASYRRHGDGSLRVEVTEAAALASARPGGDPTPADIVAWMRVVDANRAGRHRMRAIEPASRYAGSRRSRPAYGPGFRVLRGLAVGRDCAIGLFELADPDRTATLDGCLHLLVAAAHDEAPAEAVPLPVGIASAWLSAEPNRTVLEAHAFLRERTAAGLTGDIIGTDQDGVPCLALSGVRIRFAERTTRVATASRVASFREETWQPIDPEFAHRRGRRLARRALVIGASGSALRLADALAATLPIEHVRREPDAARPLLSAPPMGRANTSVVLVYAGENDSAARPSDPIGPGRDTPATTFRVLDLLQRVHADDGTAALTIVLPTITDPRLADPDAVAVPHAIAGLVRSLQLESHRVVRLVWTDTDPRSLASLADLVAQLPDTSKQPLGEIRITAGTLAVRRFTPALLRPTATAIDPTGTYVVTGGLGAAGAVAVRWLLESGARDVVVLTRAPRPVPPPLDGLEDRIVVVRCDAADPRDLAYALNDIRACGSTVRGVVHAAGATTDAAFEAITARQLTAAFAPRLRAARNLIALTATDPTDFILLFSDALGALGTPGRAADAAATAAMDSLARTHPGRGVLSVGWGGWATGSAAVREAGLAAFDPRHGSALLADVLRYPGEYLSAVDYTPTAETSPMAMRLSNLLDSTPERRPPAPPEAISIPPLGTPSPLATARTVEAP